MIWWWCPTIMMAIGEVTMVTGFKPFYLSRGTHILSDSGQWTQTICGLCQHTVDYIMRSQLCANIYGHPKTSRSQYTRMNTITWAFFGKLVSREFRQQSTLLSTFSYFSHLVRLWSQALAERCLCRNDREPVCPQRALRPSVFIIITLSYCETRMYIFYLFPHFAPNTSLYRAWYHGKNLGFVDKRMSLDSNSDTFKPCLWVNFLTCES